jgi:hypothetical protein
MKTAFVRKTATVPYKQFFNSGWETVEGIETFIGMEHLPEIDGEYDLCLVCPGGFRFDEDLYNKKPGSRTQFVFVDDEDMHQSVEMIRCIASYYDHVFIFSEVNLLALKSLGVSNVHEILPCVDPRYFKAEDIPKGFDVSFIGQLGSYIKIGEGTRLDYLIRLDGKKDKIKPFIGRGFHCEQASTIYNQSKIVLDLPVTFTVGARSMQIGATTAMLMMPSGLRSRQWFDHFMMGEDYAEFEPTFKAFHEAINFWLGDPAAMKRVSENLRKKVLAGHTFQHRFDQMIRML